MIFNPDKKIIENNYAFIDGQNLYLGIQALGWNLDYKKLRVYLREKYSVNIAYIFIGYIEKNSQLYVSLQRAGFILIFKSVMELPDGKVKGNVDAEMVLQAMIDFPVYNKAIIVTSDGDFACLVRYLIENNKLKVVLTPHSKNCSIFLKQAAKGEIHFINELKGKVSVQQKEKAPHKDKTL